MLLSLVVHWLFRLLLGGIITAAGLGKFLDLRGFVGVIKTYQFPLRNWMSWVIAIGLVVFELGLGLSILFGFQLVPASLLSFLMHLGYALLQIITLKRGIKLSNCGCFGVFLPRPLTWYSPVEDVVFALFSLGLFFLTKM